MASFLVYGKVIDKNNTPAANLEVMAYDDDLLNDDDLLGTTTTDSNGFFEIKFDESSFRGLLEFYERRPDVYLVLKNKGREILKTKVTKTEKEIEYHIKLDDHSPDPNAVDIYSANLNRLIEGAGESINMGNTINVDALRLDLLPTELRNAIQNFVNGHQDRLNNFNHLSAALSGFLNANLEENRIGTIGYDGPQVPRHPRKEAYYQAIQWPRKGLD